jgi:glycosyltransferase involved in cell wall biosynthesis
LNIGVDAGPLRGQLTGIGWSLWQNLQVLVRMARADMFLLYTTRRLSVTFEEPNVRTHLGGPLSFIPGTLWQQLMAGRYARRDRLDCFWGTMHLLPLSLPKRIRTVLTINDLVPLLYPESMTSYNAFIHRCYWQQSLARADAILAISESTKRDLVGRLGIAESRITVTHLGVEDRFRPLPMEQVQTRLRALELNPGYLLAVGTLEPRKNYPLLFQALKALPRELILVVAGGRGWKYRDILEERARLGLEERVRLVGYVGGEDLAVLYNGARLLVFPSRYEGFGLPLLQAMACGTPVLASRTSSLPEVGGDAAAYFDPQSVDSLICELQRLLNDDARLRPMRAKGIERARQFTWEQTARKTLEVLHGGES